MDTEVRRGQRSARMDDQRKQIADRVVALRDERGWTNEVLAYKAGVAVKTISRLVNVKHDSSARTIAKVAEALGVPESAIRGEEIAEHAVSAVMERFDELAQQLGALSEEVRRLHVEQAAADAEALKRLAEVRRAMRRPPREQQQ